MYCQWPQKCTRYCVCGSCLTHTVAIDRGVAKEQRMEKDRREQGSRRDFLRSAFAAGITVATVVIPIDHVQAAPRKRLPADNARPLAFFRPEEAVFVSAAVDRFI